MREDQGWCGPECPGMHGREHQKSVCPLLNNPPLPRLHELMRTPPHCQFGILFRLGSLWIGAHYSPTNRRWCINLVPFVTLWITLPWGTAP